MCTCVSLQDNVVTLADRTVAYVNLDEAVSGQSLTYCGARAIELVILYTIVTNLKWSSATLGPMCRIWFF